MRIELLREIRGRRLTWERERLVEDPSILQHACDILVITLDADDVDSLRRRTRKEVCGTAVCAQAQHFELHLGHI